MEVKGEPGICICWYFCWDIQVAQDTQEWGDLRHMQISISSINPLCIKYEQWGGEPHSSQVNKNSILPTVVISEREEPYI